MLWYNDPKNNEQFAKLGGTLHDANNELIWKECKITSNDNGVWLYGILKSATNIEKFGDKSFNIDNHYVSLLLHSKDFTVKGETVSPSPLELWLGQYLLKHYSDKCFSGQINLLNNETAINILSTGKKKDGKDASEEYLNDLIEQFVDITEIEPTELKEVELKLGKGSSGSSGFKKYSQTERERLDDRFNFLNHHLGDYGGKTLLEVTKNLEKLKEKDREFVSELWAILMYVLSEK